MKHIKIFEEFVNEAQIPGANYLTPSKKEIDSWKKADALAWLDRMNDEAYNHQQYNRESSLRSNTDAVDAVTKYLQRKGVLKVDARGFIEFQGLWRADEAIDLQKMAENGGFESVSTKNLEPISEGKREINKVVTAWKKMGVTDLNTIAKLYSDAMTDANFHQETATSKAIGAASKAKTLGLNGSDIAAAAGWEGSAIAHGTVEYLKSIGEDAASQKLLKTVNSFVSPNGMKTLES
jgi:hypothetical protein